MSDPAAYDPPPSPPPPSYEISQHEFDQKTSRVIEQSASDPPQRRVDDEGFEIWDEAVFEAALAGVNDLSLGSPSTNASASQSPSSPYAGVSSADASGSSGSPSSPPIASTRLSYGSGYPQEKAKVRPLPVPEVEGAASSSSSGSGSSAGSSAAPTSRLQLVRPLRVNKKARPPKERPSWYAEAGLGSPPSSPLASHSSSSSSSARQERPLRRQLTVFNVTEREGTPPPEFTAIGPSLDGPPYDAIVMTYEGDPPPPPSATGSPGPPAFTANSTPPAFTANSPSPAFATNSTPPPPATDSPPQRRPSASPALVPRSGSARHLPAHTQSLPQRPFPSTSSPRPHTVHQQSMPAMASTSVMRDSAAGFRASAFEPGSKPSHAPRLSFNPQMAYSKSAAPALPPPTEEPASPIVDPSAFYSGAVSAHYSFNVPQRMRKTTLSEQPSSLPQGAPIGLSSPPRNYASSILMPDKSAAPASVASPRPSYAYGQATFQESSYNPGGAWGYAPSQQGWPPAGGGSQLYR